MKRFLKILFLAFRRPIDWLLALAIVPCALVMLLFRRIGGARLPVTSYLLKRIGVYPIRDHYYEPLFNDAQLRAPLDAPRYLPGIDFREAEQLALLRRLARADEFKAFVEDDGFDLANDSFQSGDAEFLFQFIRHHKPGTVIEIGSGQSTRIARKALSLNARLDDAKARHICIEPYEMPWLEALEGIELIRSKVEDYDIDWSEALEAGDLLFIDSSHVIRPQGDVLKEYLEILPQLPAGLFVHFHDIFTPRDYPAQWVVADVKFWNEQYLLEALLSDTDRYEIVAALNYLKHEHFDALKRVCPFIDETREPCSIYLRVR